MTTLIKVQRETAMGSPDPYGATVTHEGVNFALFSQYAQEIELLLFDSPDTEASEIIKMNRSENSWHILVMGIGAGQLYNYRVHGEYNPAQGKRFNAHKVLIDPYAKAVTGKFQHQDNLIFAYETLNEHKDLVMDTRNDEPSVPKCIVMVDDFDWQGDSAPAIPMDQLIIYEVHLKGFTAHSSSGVKHPGTYLGFIEKIPYLKQLGITAVELLPVQEFFISSHLIDKGLTDYWGYNTIGFFAPESSYGTQSYPGCQVNEFKMLVQALHKAGIEVILDVVYNHTGEGNHLGPTLSFKGIDNPTYYALVSNPDNQEEPYRYYLNDTGCGNTINIEHPIVLKLVLDSLRYWVEVMHVDGFRFDLATILARDQGQFSPISQFFEAIAKDPVLSKIKMIGEPWDLTTYQVGNFPIGWSEWNGKYRDTVRRFMKGDDGQSAEMAGRLTGSADLYQSVGRKPYNSVNFITCHDGFTLRDIYSYNDKHNESNQENNQDGVNDNYSWNCGVEGETEDVEILNLRKQMVKNALCGLLFSSGTPMILYGDEVMRTQRGNNNAYCQDNELTWFNWDDVRTHAEILEFCMKAIWFRKHCQLFRWPHYFEQKEGNPVIDIAWFSKTLEAPNWHNPKTKAFCYQLCGEESDTKKRYYLLLAYNMNYRGTSIHLPSHEGLKWHRLVDTAQEGSEAFRTVNRKKLLRKQDRRYCYPRSISVLWAS